MRADAMLDKGALDGFAVWKRVLRAVEELQRVEPGAWDTGSLNLVWRHAARLVNVLPCLSSCAISPVTRHKN